MPTLQEIQLANPIGTKFRLPCFSPVWYIYFDGMRWINKDRVLIASSMDENLSTDWEVFEEPIKFVHYFNVYPDGVSLSGFGSRRAADTIAATSRIARIRVEFVEGVFDE